MDKAHARQDLPLDPCRDDREMLVAQGAQETEPPSQVATGEGLPLGHIHVEVAEKKVEAAGNESVPGGRTEKAAPTIQVLLAERPQPRDEPGPVRLERHKVGSVEERFVEPAAAERSGEELIDRAECCFVPGAGGLVKLPENRLDTVSR